MSRRVATGADRKSASFVVSFGGLPISVLS